MGPGALIALLGIGGIAAGAIIISSSKKQQGLTYQGDTGNKQLGQDVRAAAGMAGAYAGYQIGQAFGQGSFGQSEGNLLGEIGGDLAAQQLGG